LAELRRSLTVPVSEFFRTPEQFERLRRDILPRLLQERPELRIWSAGCSYGAEPYSVALLLEELTPGARHYILATDVDEQALARARAADSFSERDLRHVPSQMRAKYVAQGQLLPEIRTRVTFRAHDLRSEPSEGEFDLIVCRNVMIYLAEAAKRQLYGALYHALRTGGYLFVGDAEVLNQLPEAGFVREKVGFYRK
jgi:chemotaxis protein methyltransferase CheR